MQWLTRQRQDRFAQWFRRVALPLSGLLVCWVTVGWERTLHIAAFDGKQAGFVQYGFPLAYEMNFPGISAEGFYFVGPFLFDWLCYLAVLCTLAYSLRERLPALNTSWGKVLTWTLWIPASYTMFGLGFSMLLGGHTFTSPFRVLQEHGWHMVFFGRW